MYIFIHIYWNTFMKHVSAPYEVCQRGMTVVEVNFFGGGRVSWKDDIGIATAFSLSSPHHVNMKFQIQGVDFKVFR